MASRLSAFARFARSVLPAVAPFSASISNAAHSQIHTHFTAFAVEVGAKIVNDVLRYALSNAYNVFRSPCLFACLSDKLFLGRLALRAKFGGFVTFVYVSAY